MLYWMWMAITVVLATGVLFSSLGKLRQLPAVMDSLHSLDVTDQQIRLLGIALLAGAFGLIMGLILVPYLAPLSALALTVYFFVAGVVHVRKHVTIPVALPVFFLLSVASLVLGLVGH